MKVLRKYQLDIIFLFFALLVFIGLAFFGLEQFGQDPHKFEWLVVGPFMALYFAYCWEIRNKIELSARRNVTVKSLLYWIALGITIFISYAEPVGVKNYLSINILFLVFTLLLADSYWDFAKISLRSFRDKQER